MPSGVGHRGIGLGLEPGQLFIVARIFELIKLAAIVAMRCVSTLLQFRPFCWPAINLQSAVSSRQSAVCKSCRNAKTKLYLRGPGTSLKCIDLQNKRVEHLSAKSFACICEEFQKISQHFEEEMARAVVHNVYNQFVACMSFPPLGKNKL